MELVISLLSLFATLVTAWFAWKISATAARNDFCFQIRNWSDKVFDLIGEALAELEMARNPVEFLSIAAKAEALADSGRAYFTNTSGKPYGGVRHQAVDLVLVFADLCRALASARNFHPRVLPPSAPQPAAPNYHHAFVNVRRALVYLIFESTDIHSAPLRMSKMASFISEQRSITLWINIPILMTKPGGKGGLTFTSPKW